MNENFKLLLELLNKLSNEAHNVKIVIRIEPNASKKTAGNQVTNPSAPLPATVASLRPLPKARKLDKHSMVYSRYHFERNAMKLALLELQPVVQTDGWLQADMLARKFAEQMQLTVETGKRHVLRATRLGILESKIENNRKLVRLSVDDKPSTISFLDDEDKKTIEGAEDLLPG